MPVVTSGMFLLKLLVLFEKSGTVGTVGTVKLNSKSKGLKNVNSNCEMLEQC